MLLQLTLGDISPLVVLVVVYLLHAEIVKIEFRNATSAAMTFVSILGFLLNFVCATIYFNRSTASSIENFDMVQQMAGFNMQGMQGW